MARFDGSPVVLLLEDGRRVQLQKQLAFIDDAALRWEVPADAIVDGASIPQVLWAVIGGPFEGRYRNASIIHDWYCDRRSRPWQAVHRMFFEAMIASGVGAALARILYAGVYMGGPRWSETVVSNAGLPAPDFAGDAARADPSRTTTLYHYPLGASEFAELQRGVDGDASLDAIEAAVDARTSARTPIVGTSASPG